MRVILVGRTGQDAALRLDQSVELLRAHNPHGAIGELSSPMDDSSPALATVIVAPDVMPYERARSFVAALRRVEPTVRVLLVSSENRPEFDGTIPPAITPDALRRLVHTIHGPMQGPALGLDEDDALALGPKADEDDVLEVLMGGRGTSNEQANGRSATGLDHDGEPIDSGHHSSQGADHSPSQGARGSFTDSLGLAEDGEVQVDRDTDQNDQNEQAEHVRVGDEPVAGYPHQRTSASASESLDTLNAAQPDVRASAKRDSDDGVDAPSSSRTALADKRVLEALLAGVDVHDATRDAIREASGLGDLVLTMHDEHAEAHEGGGPPEGPHIKLVHAGLVLGYLSSPSGAHLAPVGPELTQWASLCLALSRKHRQLGEYAFTDELTGAFNRRFFNQFMSEALIRAKAQRQFLTLLYFDIDDFKVYNDRFGHEAGDDILLQAVSLLKSVIRPTDKVCRLGGDEFAVIFYDPAAGVSRSGGQQEAPLTDARIGGAPQSISAIAKRFQKQICEHRYPKLAEHAPGTLTISGGMATFPWDGRSAEELLRRADELLLQSKAQGKNLITFGPGAEQVCNLSENQ